MYAFAKKCTVNENPNIPIITLSHMPLVMPQTVLPTQSYLHYTLTVVEAVSTTPNKSLMSVCSNIVRMLAAKTENVPPYLKSKWCHVLFSKISQIVVSL